MQYIHGEARNQGSLFPVSLEELVPDDHLVRVIEAYVGRLDLSVMGFGFALIFSAQKANAPNQSGRC